MKKVIIHTDGSCRGNPGPGGWAAIIEYGKHKRELSGNSTATTNNRMELQAAIEALNALKESCEVEFYTDSQYVKNGVQSWLAGWKQNGWKTKTKNPVKNEDLWRALDTAVSRHRIKWHWVKGHAGHAANERCDELARAVNPNNPERVVPSRFEIALLESSDRHHDECRVQREKVGVPLKNSPPRNIRDEYQQPSRHLRGDEPVLDTLEVGNVPENGIEKDDR